MYSITIIIGITICVLDKTSIQKSHCIPFLDQSDLNIQKSDLREKQLDQSDLNIQNISIWEQLDQSDLSIH